jgi:hypothetical protein
MPIDREKERFVQEKVPFEMVSREVIQTINLPEALAIWVYLQSLPPNWIPRREQIRERFNLGRDRYGVAMKELKDLGLVWDATVRDGQGRIIQKVMTVQALMDSQRAHLVTGKPTSRVSLYDGETDHLKNKRLLKEKDNKRASQFDAWWLTYPRKSGKKRARLLFGKLSQSDLDGCLADKASLRYEGRSKEHIPQADTYLSQHKWEDEQDHTPAQPKQRWL